VGATTCFAPSSTCVAPAPSASHLPHSAFLTAPFLSRQTGTLPLDFQMGAPLLHRAAERNRVSAAKLILESRANVSLAHSTAPSAPYAQPIRPLR
jgi:hypothetical protein